MSVYERLRASSQTDLVTGRVAARFIYGRPSKITVRAFIYGRPP